MATVAVVNNSALAEPLAAMMGAELVPAIGAAPEGASVVMVCSSHRDVQDAARAVADQHPPAVVVAWHLPESDLARLLDLGVQCLVGEPSSEQLREALGRGAQPVDNTDRSRAAARFGLLESWLSQPAKPIPGAAGRSRATYPSPSNSA